MRMRALLFPDPPRRIPAQRGLGIALRTAHILTFGVLLGGHVFAVEPARLLPFLLATLASGIALMALELVSTCSWLFTGKGAGVLFKLALLAMVLVFWEHRVPILVLVVIVAGVTSHMPARFRHRILVPLVERSPSEDRARAGPGAVGSGASGEEDKAGRGQGMRGDGPEPSP
jgi:hypothetical protein